MANSLSTFGQARADRYQRRTQLAARQRRTMLALEHAGEKPLDEVGKIRGEVLERQLSRLQRAQEAETPD